MILEISGIYVRAEVQRPECGVAPDKEFQQLDRRILFTTYLPSYSGWVKGLITFVQSKSSIKGVLVCLLVKCWKSDLRCSSNSTVQS